eukprot:3573325-Pleurochrysis_carterae.AAC.2
MTYSVVGLVFTKSVANGPAGRWGHDSLGVCCACRRVGHRRSRLAESLRCGDAPVAGVRVDRGGAAAARRTGR